MRELPAELLVAEKYSMLSKPVICCSMICVTVFSTVSAEAPGYVESMAIEGGAIGGYCDMGNLKIANPPPTIMMMAITHAKTGRSRKNRDNIKRLR